MHQRKAYFNSIGEISSLASSCGPSPATLRRPWPSTSSSLPMRPRPPPCGSGPTRSLVGHHSPPPAPCGVLVLDPGSGPHRSCRRLCTLVPRLRLRLRISAGSMENREGGGSSSLVRKPCTIERSSPLSPNPCSCVAEQGTHIHSILNQSASRVQATKFSIGAILYRRINNPGIRGAGATGIDAPRKITIAPRSAHQVAAGTARRPHHR
jgi:hypothetical protein